MKKILALFSLGLPLNLMASPGVSAIIQTCAPDKKYTNEIILHHTLTKELSSKINGIKYNLYISLPKEYASNNKDYPIIYLLDADYSFALLPRHLNIAKNAMLHKQSLSS